MISLTLIQSIDNLETKVIDYWLNSCSYILKEAIAPNLKSIPNNLESNMRLFQYFAEIWRQKCKHLACKNQSEMSSSILIGSYLLNVNIFEVKFLQQI